VNPYVRRVKSAPAVPTPTDLASWRPGDSRFGALRNDFTTPAAPAPATPTPATPASVTEQAPATSETPASVAENVAQER
jgi:hypothetical protein